MKVQVKKVFTLFLCFGVLVGIWGCGLDLEEFRFQIRNYFDILASEETIREKLQGMQEYIDREIFFVIEFYEEKDKEPRVVFGDSRMDYLDHWYNIYQKLDGPITYSLNEVVEGGRNEAIVHGYLSLIMEGQDIGVEFSYRFRDTGGERWVKREVIKENWYYYGLE